MAVGNLSAANWVGVCSDVIRISQWTICLPDLPLVYRRWKENYAFCWGPGFKKERKKEI